MFRMSLGQNISYRPNVYVNHTQTPNLAKIPTQFQTKPLAAPMISRIHNIRPGCGSCGRG
jgi:hypothetical protein